MTLDLGLGKEMNKKVCDFSFVGKGGMWQNWFLWKSIEAKTWGSLVIFIRCLLASKSEPLEL